ncbi:MAG TPA: hypothetical protein VFR24_12120 [Candidatus Angelobacter sp.]|nr:hypothetical protein [Candidatus Angelobacter sp.]
MHFQPIDYIPWIGSIIAELIVLAIMLKRGLVRRFPVFFTSIVFDILREIILPIIAFRNPILTLIPTPIGSPFLWNTSSLSP